ncbi:hypothetical protein B296_00051399 [Ensete ventricosum]|uniref:1-phosphatidylinositol-4-phosphate 5-kinase n=1 Tax=Ensete ventricosum TaxID=4639 RepID=A0A426YGS6_ENSVE|nr:hypothetical protein B296_00051399 [Ensete ventricosum]
MTHYYKQVRFVVVGNVLRSDKSIHKKFNLGISPQGRVVSKAGAEEELNVAFHLHAAVRHRLLRFESELGIRMTARAVDTQRKEGNLASSLCHPRKQPPNNVILYLGIVNILQGHSKLKHVEHVFRSLQSDSPMILAVNPKVYSTHFEEFLRKTFPESEAEKIKKEL